MQKQTQEELNIWRQRAQIEPYKTVWEQRILSKADSFRANPVDGIWQGWEGPGCVPETNPPLPGRINGDKLLASAFAFLITEDVTYRDPVRNQLLVQAQFPGTDFSNTDSWCGSMLVLRAHEYGPWLTTTVPSFQTLRSPSAL